MYPPVSLFEDTLNPEDYDDAYEIEALTNDRLRQEVGLLDLVPPEDRVSGPGASPVMAAFTHIHSPSRFTAGDYGVYYCADTMAAAIAETRFHKERILRATLQPSQEITMRAYVNSVVQPLVDIRAGHDDLHQADLESYAATQSFGAKHRRAKAWGLLYRSVRHPGGECAAVFRPPAVTLPVQGAHLRFVWDSKVQRIVSVLEIKEVA